jgi:hypothetical protein
MSEFDSRGTEFPSEGESFGGKTGHNSNSFVVQHTKRRFRPLDERTDWTYKTYIYIDIQSPCGAACNYLSQKSVNFHSDRYYIFNFCCM